MQTQLIGTSKTASRSVLAVLGVVAALAGCGGEVVDESESGEAAGALEAAALTAAAGTTPQQALAQFGACMSFDDFKSTGVASLSTYAAPPCVACHSSRGVIALVDPDQRRTFDLFRKDNLPLFATAVTGKDGSIQFVATNGYRNKGTSVHAGGRYVLPASMRFDRLFDLTVKHYKDKRCP